MPRPDTSLRRRIADYALGMISESGWILAMCVFAYLIAAVAVAVFR